MMAELSGNCRTDKVFGLMETCEMTELSHTGKNCELQGTKRSVSEYRYSIVSGMEAYVRWSMERSLLWPKHAFSFMVMTVVKDVVHLSVTEVKAGKFETHQWIVSSEVRLEEIVAVMGFMVDLNSCHYIFTPGCVRSLPLSHLGAYLTRKVLSSQFPQAKVIHLDDICRTSSGIFVRRIGADVHRYTEALGAQKTMMWYGDTHEHDALTSAVESDSAALIKLIATPVSAYLQKRTDMGNLRDVSLREIR